MAIDIRNYKPVSDEGRRSGDNRSYYIMANGEKTQCRLSLGRLITDELMAEFGGSVGLSYSRQSGVLLIHQADYDNSRLVSRPAKNGRAAIRGTISVTCLEKVPERLFGIHRRYYVDITKDEDLEGNPVYVVTPTGEVS